MDATTLLDLYNRVRRGKSRLPSIHPNTTSLEAKPERLASAEDALARLVAFGPKEGWAGFQSANRTFTETPPAMDHTTGMMLAAEAVNAAGESLHIRYGGTGNWIATRYTPAAGGEYQYLCDTVALIAIDDELNRLRYRRYWRIDRERGAEPFAACFIGFGEE